jgi:2-polyprenyl-3-methyl-5-hydroxy-6-metoxy-1,4-benzoquinol methylase
VLDVGCGIGSLAYDLAANAGGIVTGIDINSESLEYARIHFQHPNLTFIEGDILTMPLTEPFDVIVLSNVLEHLNERIHFLQNLTTHIRPKRFLLRVPMINRHWSVPLRKELGLKYLSDPTHFTEYTKQEFETEMQVAGLRVRHLQINWGEIWAEVVCNESTS